MVKLVMFALLGPIAWASNVVRADDASQAPDGWQRQAPRPDIAPRFRVQLSSAETGPYQLGLAGRGSESVDGRWVRTVPVVAGKHYSFRAEFRAEKVTNPARSILARVLWLDGAGKQLDQAEYPLTSRDATKDGWSVVTSTYRAPAAASQARLELHLRWSANGVVVWRRANLSETNATVGRKVRLAAVNHRPRGSRSPQENLEQFAKLIGEAAGHKADIVCLPEGITLVGTEKTYAEVAESIPGFSTGFLGEHARKHRLYVVAGLYERDDKTIYNTSVLLDRNGKLVGKYRKVCLPREEIDGGITPGKEYPVFSTDFGQIGMMICWDVHFPEVARELAARGAEVVLMPIWGGNETLARARAIENQVYLVASGYDFQTAIYDRAGQRTATTSKDPAVIVADVDLNERLLWPWLGDWRARIWREGPARNENNSSRRE